jgi:hypothetical protein
MALFIFETVLDSGLTENRTKNRMVKDNSKTKHKYVQFLNMSGIRMSGLESSLYL